MTEIFRLESPPLDVEALSLEVERRVRPGPDEPPSRGPPEGPAESQSPTSSPVEALLASLSEDADAQIVGGQIVCERR